jgi:hypothetical protein
MIPTTDRTHRTDRTGSAVLRLLAALAGELGILGLLVVVGRDDPGSPPLTGWGDGSLGRWLAGRDPVDAVAGAGRHVAIVLSAYLVAVTILHLTAVTTRFQRLRRVATVLGPRFLVGLAASAALGSSPALAADAPTTPSDANAGAGATMEVVGPASSGTALVRTSLPWATGAAPAPVPERQVPEPPPPPPPTELNRDVTVEPGDNFWSIARRELRGRLGRAPTNAEIAPFWNTLIELNRDQLVEPTNPDLIYPGQTFLLP